MPAQYPGDDMLGPDDGLLWRLRESHMHGLVDERRQPLAWRQSRIDFDQTIVGKGLTGRPFTAKLAFLEDQLSRHLLSLIAYETVEFLPIAPLAFAQLERTSALIKRLDRILADGNTRKITFGL